MFNFLNIKPEFKLMKFPNLSQHKLIRVNINEINLPALSENDKGTSTENFKKYSQNNFGSLNNLNNNTNDSLRE